MMVLFRSAILNVMSSPYVETAELKGLDTLRIIARHAAPNALAPIINVVALNLAYLVVGVVVVEVVFVYPGMGQYMVDAVTVRDLPVVQACGLIFAAVYILLNMSADVLAIVANPRLRHPKSEEHTSELQSLMRISYAVFCLKKKTNNADTYNQTHNKSKKRKERHIN